MCVVGYTKSAIKMVRRDECRRNARWRELQPVKSPQLWRTILTATYQTDANGRFPPDEHALANTATSCSGSATQTITVEELSDGHHLERFVASFFC